MTMIQVCPARVFEKAPRERRSGAIGAMLVAALSAVPLKSALAHNDAAVAPLSSRGRCLPLGEVLGAAKAYAANGKGKTSVFIDGPGAALLQAINLESGSRDVGAGVFALELLGSRQVIVGIIARDGSRICDWYLLTTDGWDAIRTEAFGQVAILTRSSS